MIELLTVFSIEMDGHLVTWNVTALQVAVRDGLFGPPQQLDLSLLPPSDWSKGFMTRSRVDQIKRDPAMLADPAIAIQNTPARQRVGGLLYCFADGQHRITARQELQLSVFRTYIVPHDRERDFRL